MDTNKRCTTQLTGFSYDLNDTQSGLRGWRNGIHIFCDLQNMTNFKPVHENWI